MWERIYENEATLPLFDEKYEPKDTLELFSPIIKETKQTIIQNPCAKSKRVSYPSVDELKKAFWAEELRDNKKSKNKGAIYE